MAKQTKGSLSINSDNIFPIIKKWLYSDHDIFIREVVSNACDAVTKLRKLALIGEYEEAEDTKYRIDVIASPNDKTAYIMFRASFLDLWYVTIGRQTL